VWFPLGIIVVFLALVGLHRLLASRWRTSQSAGRGTSPTAFTTIWLLTTPPRSSLFAHRDRSVGALSIDRERLQAQFTARRGDDVVLAGIQGVDMGGRGTDFANIYVRAHCSHDRSPPVVYLNDGRWMGWRPMLTGSNFRLARALAAIIDHDSATRDG
jgi:hypothetical protein